MMQLNKIIQQPATCNEDVLLKISVKDIEKCNGKFASLHFLLIVAFYEGK